MTAASEARIEGDLLGGGPATPHPPLHGWRGGRGDMSERQREAALPGDVVLRLVESVAVELVDEVAALRADADAPHPVLEPRAEVAGELGPGVAGAQLMHADGTGPAQHVGTEGGGTGLDGIAQHEGCVVGELVELPPARQCGAKQAVLRPTAAGADADIALQPHGPVDRA